MEDKNAKKTIIHRILNGQYPKRKYHYPLALAKEKIFGYAYALHREDKKMFQLFSRSMKPTPSIRKKYGKTIKTVLLVINIILFLLTIRMYVHYGHILETTQQEQHETFIMQQEEAYEKNFTQPYLQSIYAPYFKGHENNTLYQKEFLVSFKTKHIVTQEDLDHSSTSKDTPSGKQTPAQERNTLLKKKFGSIQ